MSRTLIPLLVLLCVALVAVWVLYLDGENAIAPDATEATPQPNVDQVARPAVPEPQRDIATPPPEVVPPQPAPMALKTIRLKGECRDWDNLNKPAPGVTLRLKIGLHNLGNCNLKLNQVNSWKAPEPVVTAADGTFSILCQVPDLEWPLSFSTDAPRTAQGEFWYDPDGDPPTLVDGVPEFKTEWVLVLRGYPLRGTVVNHRGEPIDNAAVLFECSYARRGDVPDDEAVAFVRNGRFDCGHVTEGSVRATIVGDRGQLLGRDVFEVGPDHDTTNVKLVLHETPAVEGVVVDPRTNRPVAGFPVFVDFTHETELRRYTDARGHFKIHGPSFLDTHVRFRSAYDPDDPRPCLSGPLGWLRIPTRGVVLRIRPWPEFKIRALHSDGSPATDLRVLASGPGQVCLVGKPENGVTRWIGVQPNPVQIRVISKPPRVEMSALLPFDPEQWTESPLLVKLEPAKTLAVHVANVKRLPNPPYAELADATGWELATGKLDSKPDSKPDTAGVINLTVPARIRGYTLMVRSVFHSVYHTITQADEQRGRVDVAFDLPAPPPPGAAMLQVRVDAKPQPEPRRVRNLFAVQHKQSAKVYSLDFRGRVEVPAGHYDVVIQAAQTGWSPVRGRHVPNIPKRVVASVELDAGDDEQITVTLPELEPCRVTGTVRHAGRLLRNAKLRFVSTNGLWSSRVESDAEGRYLVEELPGGSYHVCAFEQVVLDLTNQRELWFTGQVDATPGPATTADLVTSAATLRLRVRFADGTLASDRVIDVADYGPARTDAQGRVDIRPIPPGPITLRCVSLLPERSLRKATVKGPHGDGIVDVVLK